jgi:ketosteroid isomerase-like protein
MSLASDRIEVSGDLAFARGHYADRYTDPKANQVRSEAGTFLMIYKKQDDGSWKIIEDFSAPYTSPQPPPK